VHPSSVVANAQEVAVNASRFDEGALRLRDEIVHGGASPMDIIFVIIFAIAWIKLIRQSPRKPRHHFLLARVQYLRC
jgi:hypothetical protein